MSKIIVITGASSGIGLELAKICLDHTWQVYNVSRKPACIKDTRIINVYCDLNQSFTVIQDNLKPILGLERIDYLVNNAGVYFLNELEYLTIDQIEALIRVNLLATIYLTRLILPKFKQQNFGTILNVASAAGTPFGGKSGESVYTAAKYGVVGFIEGLKKEIKETGHNIRVLGLHPASVDTNLFSQTNQDNLDKSKFMSAKDIAETIFFMLTRTQRVMMDYVVVNRNKNF